MTMILRSDPTRQFREYADFVLSIPPGNVNECRIENFYFRESDNRLVIVFIKQGILYERDFLIYEGAESIPDPATSVVTEKAFGQSEAVGSSLNYSRQDHTHGTPTNPIPAHESAGDPHTVYLREADGSVNDFGEKTVPAANDILLLEDSAAGYAKKKVKFSKFGGGISSVNEVAVSNLDLDDDAIAAPSGGVNVKWQRNSTDVTAYLPWSVYLFDAIRKAPLFYTDFLRSDANTPWVNAVIGTGTIAISSVSSTDHPGVCGISGGGTINDGGYFLTHSTFKIGGGETCELVFYTPSSFSVRTFRMGWVDSVQSTANGIYTYYSTTSAFYGRCTKASSTTNTGTSYTLSVSTWYRQKIVVNSNASRVDFYLYDMSGTQLWTDYVTSDIPLTTTAMYHGCFGWVTDTSVVTAGYPDWMSLGYDITLRTLAR